ncbi:S-adenosyl-L-methionine-dependent methyltransferase [Dunaliella salina]|uniref:S-adenosyl-L-methionine-dependent methyltransferase n=1 Tax=Dunaliella salina TaxID=3046 RepID=A0ABQ7GBC5_DUNSA|nr:S-adenosyl-L-methionine-dependent methyltransferase [Dunaliella salina]|eukprot:KAF5831893.1 S-adenosyl-L-methionine-dependent methyltransferase [Dunaliella salina]
MWNAGLKPGEAFDARDASPMLKHLIETGKIDVRGKRVLVPGCGRGYDVVALVAAGAEAAVGLELSDRAVEEAKIYLEESKQRLNLSEDAAKRASFLQGEFFSWEPEGGPFDWGYDYTFFCAMHPTMREGQTKSWARVLKAGGELVTLIFPVSAEMDPNQGPPWPVTPEMYQEHFGGAGFALEQMNSVPPELSHKGREGKEFLAFWRRQ